ncbi:MAG: DUF6465 family protein [Lachnospiraceae bacterium]|nr:DUF6465 family protein [Lachnospiraceae bacterium]
MTPVKKTAAVKDTVKETKATVAEAAKKVETKAAVKEEAAKKETVKKETKTAAKKTTAKKAEVKAALTIEFAGQQFSADEIVKKATAAAEAQGEVKTLEIYVKPEENAAYYVVNGEGSDDYKVEL